MAIGIAVASLLLSSAELPDARIGVVINLAIVGALVAGRQFASSAGSDRLARTSLRR
jgi:hypothetical protein